jgi:DNA-binding MarR family transcriptional regulator
VTVDQHRAPGAGRRPGRVEAAEDRHVAGACRLEDLPEVGGRLADRNAAADRGDGHELDAGLATQPQEGRRIVDGTVAVHDKFHAMSPLSEKMQQEIAALEALPLDQLEDALRHHSAGTTPGFLLRHAALRWQRQVAAALDSMSLTHVQFLVLSSAWWLGREGSMPNQREVAAHAGLEPVLTSQVVRTLERAGHVTRDRDPRDARAVLVQVTQSGKDLARRCVVILDKLGEEFFADAMATPGFLDAIRSLAGRDLTGDPVQ